MAMARCKECGHDVSDSARTCPHCGVNNPTVSAGQMFIGFVIIIGGITWGAMAYFSGDDPPPSFISYTSEGARISNKNLAPKPKQSEISLPASQVAFVEAIKQSAREYNDAGNALKKFAVRTRRGDRLRAALGRSLKVEGWVGTIENLETNSEGNAILVLSLQSFDVELKTWNNALSDYADDTLIAQSSSLYTALAEMKEGQRVIFSGTFMGDTRDYVEEVSLTEAGSMSAPEFIFRFMVVSPYDL